MATDEPVVEFIADGLARPPEHLIQAVGVALWEQRFTPRNLRLKGVVAAFQWLGQIRHFGPVLGESRRPTFGAVSDEHAAALAVAQGLPHAQPEVEPDFAQGVADMLAYAINHAAPEPVQLVHTEVPPEMRQAAE